MSFSKTFKTKKIDRREMNEKTISNLNEVVSNNFNSENSMKQSSMKQIFR